MCLKFEPAAQWQSGVPDPGPEDPEAEGHVAVTRGQQADAGREAQEKVRFGCQGREGSRGIGDGRGRCVWGGLEGGGGREVE